MAMEVNLGYTSYGNLFEGKPRKILLANRV
jgi:hypothetical protein